MAKQVASVQCEKCQTLYRVKVKRGKDGGKPSRGCPRCGLEAQNLKVQSEVRDSGE